MNGILVLVLMLIVGGIIGATLMLLPNILWQMLVERLQESSSRNVRGFGRTLEEKVTRINVRYEPYKIVFNEARPRWLTATLVTAAFVWKIVSVFTGLGLAVAFGEWLSG